VAGATFWADSFLPRPAALFLSTLAGVLRRRAARTLGSILKRSPQAALPSVSVIASPSSSRRCRGLPCASNDPGDQDGRDRAERRVVVLALDHDEPVVALGERRVDVPSVISCHVKGLAQPSIARLSDALVSGHQSGLVDLGHKASEGSDARQVGEAVEVARVGQDGRREDGPEPRGRADDALRVGFVVENGDPLVGGGNRAAGI
jgi:hypothetical protein